MLGNFHPNVLLLQVVVDREMCAGKKVQLGVNRFVARKTEEDLVFEDYEGKGQTARLTILSLLCVQTTFSEPASERYWSLFSLHMNECAELLVWLSGEGGGGTRASASGGEQGEGEVQYGGQDSCQVSTNLL